MEVVNVNGTDYVQVPDEISLFGRTYRLVSDIDSGVDVSDWTPIKGDVESVTVREYVHERHPEAKHFNLAGLGKMVHQAVVEAGLKSHIVCTDGGGNALYDESCASVLESTFNKWWFCRVRPIATVN